MTARQKTRTSSAKAKPRRRQSKRGKIQAGIERPKGVTIPELQKLTGWQSHSIRAAISRLRKSGVAVNRIVINGKSRYVVAGEADGAKT